MSLDLDHRGRPVTGMVSQPAGQYVVGVEVKSRPWVLPLVDTPSGPPVIPRCRDRHIIRTEDEVVVVDVATRVTTYPRTTTVEALRKSVQESVDEDSPGAWHLCGYESGIEAMVKRLVRKLRRCGVQVQ